MVGKLFFNIIQTKCFVLKPEKVCKKSSWWGKCVQSEWKKKAHLRDPIPYWLVFLFSIAKMSVEWDKRVLFKKMLIGTNRDFLFIAECWKLSTNMCLSPLILLYLFRKTYVLSWFPNKELILYLILQKNCFIFELRCEFFFAQRFLPILVSKKKVINNLSLWISCFMLSGACIEDFLHSK